ncbi:TetR/AcrR family transcriptional regulator [Saccharopolyspora flava]|uniref:Transcriptional regulator, TetR family n=1 Tax=Saccharopolyspora flava TaxID=95161 RepID=A0A1I6UCY7_9PSEU|nr:TetR/AcrR family transcriptional regulator [Saccharopolyspora flava]SFS99349.1 transcriptional regulator, TetR family [Saccharopolyspora flava]
MARWEGNTRSRLERAALDLFTEQGYDRTTVSQIAQRANLTERSFYRWFSDKREALFGGSEELEQRLVAEIGTVPEGESALDTLMIALAAGPEVFRPKDFLRERSALIAANPALRERELVKLAALGEALTEALTERGHDPQTARLATEAALAIARLAGERWAADDTTTYDEALTTSRTDLRNILTS